MKINHQKQTNRKTNYHEKKTNKKRKKKKKKTEVRKRRGIYFLNETSACG
jgi:hypothetical protein